MHILRPDIEWRYIKGAIKMVIKRVKKITFGEDNSYYRRSIRSNELFFVVKISNIYKKNILDRLTGGI